MAEQITISFYADADIDATLKAWAKDEDRSVSAVIRRIIEAERIRRSQQLSLTLAETEETPKEQFKLGIEA